MTRVRKGHQGGHGCWEDTRAKGSTLLSGQEGLPRGNDAETVPEPSGEMDPSQGMYVEDSERAGRSPDGLTLLNWSQL